RLHSLAVLLSRRIVALRTAAWFAIKAVSAFAPAVHGALLFSATTTVTTTRRANATSPGADTTTTGTPIRVHASELASARGAWVSAAAALAGRSTAQQ